LNEVVKEFFRRIPSDVQKTVCEVFGWDEGLATELRYDQRAVLSELSKLDENRIAQFLMLCSFAHYGANQYKQHQVDQKPVVQLSADRGVNHQLIDAQVRVELCAKKYKSAHEAYLTKVMSGGKAQKPVVYETPALALKTESQKADVTTKQSVQDPVKPTRSKRKPKKASANKR
jgi:hypothetical protein